jgi:hypothetical protein
MVRGAKCSNFTNGSVFWKVKKLRKKNIFLLLHFSLKTQLRKWIIYDYVTIIGVPSWSMTRLRWELLRDYSKKLEEITNTLWLLHFVHGYFKHFSIIYSNENLLIPIYTCQSLQFQHETYKISYFGLTINSNMKQTFLVRNFIKVRPRGVELFPADGQTDRHDEGKFDICLTMY